MLTDVELVASARSGDRSALSEMYDRYADRLYDLCTSVLRDADAAFDAMVDTFVLAALELYRLRRPDNLESWLFALSRQRLLGSDIPMGVDEHAELDGASSKAQSDGAGAIVWEAASWLRAKDRVLLDLHARQPLPNRALADTLGVSPPHAAALVRDLDEKLERQLRALLVVRLARPDCERVKHLVASEDKTHPNKWLQHVAAHVDVCRICSPLREEQPSAIRLIAEVPAEPAPPEVRDEVLDRVDLLWSVLGPPEWTAAVLGRPAPDLPDSASEDATEGGGEPAPAPAESEPLDAPAEAAADETVEEAVDGAGEPTAPVDITPVPASREGAGESEAALREEYEAYDEVESLMPPPPRLRRSGFPRSMYPRRRRLVRAAIIVLAGLFAAGIVVNFRGVGRETRYFAPEAKAAAAVAGEQPPTTTAPSTNTPTTTTAPARDTRAPFVYNLATVFGCIGPRQTTTSALASVVDPGDHLATVELVFVDPSAGQTSRRMIATGGAFEAPIGPYTADGTISWLVVATDEAGNTSSAGGPSVAASASC